VGVSEPEARRLVLRLKEDIAFGYINPTRLCSLSERHPCRHRLATIGGANSHDRRFAMANLKTTGMALATAAALLFGSVAVTTAQAEDAKVKCQGGNACKGKSACATATSSCQGQNSCKGTGYVMLTKSECETAKKQNATEKKS
jgi:hypothetical protein